MNTFEFNVKIEAHSATEAKQLLQSMFDLMKTAKAQTTAQDFINMAAKIKANPQLVKKAMLFI